MILPKIPIDPKSRINDTPGVTVGHWSDLKAKTGCSVLVFEKQAAAGVRIWGGAPGVSETALLDPATLTTGIDAILLTGGSTFGLDAASGVRQYLEKKNRGFSAPPFKMPLVPAAVIFDLLNGDGRVRPSANEGYLACVDAEKSNRDIGSVGAGTGAMVAKYLGHDRGRKGGLGSCSVTLDNGVTIGAIVAANSFGAVVDPSTGEYVAAPADDAGTPIGYLDGPVSPPKFGSATVIGAVVTDAALTKATASRVAAMAQAGVARCVVPAYTPYDGDTIFAVSTGDKEADITLIGAWAARLVEQCIVSSCTSVPLD